MKKFISNVFIFLIIVFLFNIVVFVFANDNYYKGHTDFPDKKFQSFFMADSHGIALEKFTEKYNAYNFSTSSDSYLDMERKVRYLVENDYKVNKIYITVDRHTLSPYREKSNNADRSIIYTSKHDFNYLKERYLKYYFPIFQIKLNGLFRFYLESKVKKIFTSKKNIENNFTWHKLPESEQSKRTMERIEGQFPSKNNSKILEKTLSEIINICKRNNIELIGVQLPLSNNYLKTLDDRNYGADQLFISKGLKVLNYQSIFVDQQEYFSDQDHLNSKGGEQFVKILFDR